MELTPWSSLEPEFLASWGRPDGKVEAEHIAIVGPTGSGKSMFQTYVAKARAELRGTNAFIICTKPADSTLTKMGWPIVRKWPPEFGKHENFILWPPSPKDEDEAHRIQRDMIREALTSIWHKNAHIMVIFDEIAYLEDELGLKLLVRRFWRESRSLGITMVACTQRPTYVSRYMWSEPSWIVAFAPNDEDEMPRVAQVLGGRKQFGPELMNLGRYEFLIRNRRSKEVYKSKLGT